MSNLRSLAPLATPLAAVLLLAGCTAPTPQPTTSPTPSALPAGEQSIGVEGACTILAVIEQGLMAAELLPGTGQVDAAGRDAQLKLVGIQIVQAATVFDGEFRDDYRQIMLAGPGSDFRPSEPTAFDPGAPAFQEAVSALHETCREAGYQFGAMAVTPGG